MEIRCRSAPCNGHLSQALGTSSDNWNQGTSGTVFNHLPLSQLRRNTTDTTSAWFQQMSGLPLRRVLPFIYAPFRVAVKKHDGAGH